VIFGKKSGGLVEGFFVVLPGFLKGVLDKAGVLAWFFAGKNVVECVVNVVS
jgi:hypothetical protein